MFTNTTDTVARYGCAPKRDFDNSIGSFIPNFLYSTAAQMAIIEKGRANIVASTRLFSTFNLFVPHITAISPSNAIQCSFSYFSMPCPLLNLVKKLV